LPTSRLDANVQWFAGLRVKRFEAVIFDMDGLLLDTETIALAAFHDTCEHFGVEDETKLFERCIGTYAARSEQTLREGLGGEFDHLSFACMWDANISRGH